MKPIKMFGLAALAALMAMAFVGAGSAMAESTALCSTDPGTGPAESCSSIVTHVHETTLSGAKAILLASPEIQCDVLFLGDTVAGTGAPLEIQGNFTYTNCGSGCEVTETSAHSTIKVLSLGHELGDVTGAGVVHVNCIGINCEYNGEGLLGHALGPLLSTETNGGVSLEEQSVKKLAGGFLCPKTAKLDILTTPLSATYIEGGLHYCVKYEHNTNGLYKDSKCTEKVAAGPYDLVIAEPGLNVGQMLCVLMGHGLWKERVSNTECKNDSINLSDSLYELGEIVFVQ